MHEVLHVLGLCHDAPMHLDLLDVAMYGTPVSTALYIWRNELLNYFKNIVTYFKNLRRSN
jgi:hypothetical protein